MAYFYNIFVSFSDFFLRADFFMLLELPIGYPNRKRRENEAPSSENLPLVVIQGDVF